MQKTQTISKNQEFHLNAPAAKSVMLAGDFTQWQQKPVTMRKSNGGVWSTRIALASGQHTYRFIVDGKWCDDPDCRQRVPNPFGSQNMVRQVS
ncbi:MAG TPA: glycogen-binding domain-containing protein [Candidatus Sulfotelmatobacter sp.]|nr:glycogen-binding domain-containing protein [Candidatus Sulfotelmatobacter sp.]